MNTTTFTNVQTSAETNTVELRELIELEAVLVGGGDVSGVGY